MFTYFPTALADSRTVSRLRGRNVGVRTCVGSMEKGISLSVRLDIHIHICACLDIDE